MSFLESLSPKRQAIKKSTTVILIATSLAAVIVSFSIVSLKFLWDLSAYNSKVTSKKENVRDTLKYNLSVVPNLYEKFEQLEKGETNSEIILDALPSKYDFPALGSSVEYLVTSSGMLLKSFDGDDLEGEMPNQDPDPEPIAMPVSVSATGSYEALVELIGKFDRSIRPFKINYLKISGTDKNIKADIQLESYYQPAVSLELRTEVVRD